MNKEQKKMKICKKIVKFFARNIMGFIIGIIVASTVTVLAATVLNSSEISYSNTTSGLSSTNVQAAIDELYNISKTHCPDGYICKLPTLAEAILNNNTLITANPTLTASSNNTSDASGLYKSTATNFNGVEGTPTYYFRGNVENNYVSFAGQTWRIVRINEDGTIRIIMANGINNDAAYAFNSSNNNYSYMYYSNSNAKTQLETWYTNNIASNENYVSKVATGDYFCEQAKVKYSSSYTSGSASMTVYSSYTPDFKCSADANGKGLVNASVGLITYDEEVFAGGYLNQDNSNYYLYNNTSYWTMSPAGFGSRANGWMVSSTGRVGNPIVTYAHRLRAVLNLKADTAVTGSGTSTDPWIVG